MRFRHVTLFFAIANATYAALSLPSGVAWWVHLIVAAGCLWAWMDDRRREPQSNGVAK